MTDRIRFDGAALGTRIKLLRELRDMTLQQVADASGLTKSHVWEIEQGKSTNPTVNAIWGLSAGLCVSPAMLLGLDDKMPPIDPVALKIAGIVDREIKRAVAAQLKAGPEAAESTVVVGLQRIVDKAEARS